MTIAIIDDDISYMDELQKIISEYLKNQCVGHTITVFSSGEKFLDSCTEFDAVFLDIKMGGIDGIETGQIFRTYHKKTALFYISSYPEYIMDSMTVHPFAFITKPVKKEELYKNLNDYLKYMNVRNDELILPTDHTFQFLCGEKKITVNVNEIYYFQYDGNRNISAVTASGVYKFKKSMSKLYESLDSRIFLFPHQSFIVNINHINSVQGKEKTIIMKNGDIIFIARRKYNDILQSINRAFLK